LVPRRAIWEGQEVSRLSPAGSSGRYEAGAEGLAPRPCAIASFAERGPAAPRHPTFFLEVRRAPALRNRETTYQALRARSHIGARSPRRLSGRPRQRGGQPSFGGPSTALYYRLEDRPSLAHRRTLFPLASAIGRDTHVSSIQTSKPAKYSMSGLLSYWQSRSYRPLGRSAAHCRRFISGAWSCFD
jgi:hypothetical protein